MKSKIIAFAAATVLFSAGAANAETPKDYAPSDYLVYVDQPTGYAFVRTPYGWTFVRKIEAPQLAEQATQLQLALNQKR